MLTLLVGVMALRRGVSGLGWALVLTSVAWAAWVGPAAAYPRPRDESRVRLWEIAVLAALTILGGALRTLALDVLPPGCWFDEAENGLETLRLLSGDFFVFTPHNNGRGALQFFWTAPFFHGFGPTPWALRLAIATVGTLTIPATWLLFRRWVGGGWGLFGAALLAFSLWHLHVSRIAFDVAFTPLFDVLAIYATVLAGTSGSTVGWACAGALAGLANYGYQASRVTPLVVAAFVSVPTEATARGRRVRGAWVAAAGFLLVVLPLVVYASMNVRRFVQRGKQVNVVREVLDTGSVAPAVRSVTSTLRMFHERGDANPRHHNPGLPMLDPATGTLFALGLAWGTRVAGRPLFLATFAWLIVPLVFGGVLTVGAPHANRTAAAIPAVCLIATWGARGLLEGAGLSSRTKVAAAVLLVLGVGASSALSYFVDYRAVPGLSDAFSAPATGVGEYVAKVPASTMVRVAGFNPSVVRFVSGRLGSNLEFLPQEGVAGALAEPGLVIVPDAAAFADAISLGTHVVRTERVRFGGRFDVIEAPSPGPP